MNADLEAEAKALEAARKAAHEALTAAERAWHHYAALVDVGPERTRAFNTYENLRQARWV